jgi:hypothetical protein
MLLILMIQGGGSQQFTAQRMTFDGCATAVQLIWDWAWVRHTSLLHLKFPSFVQLKR